MHKISGNDRACDFEHRFFLTRRQENESREVVTPFFVWYQIDFFLVFREALNAVSYHDVSKDRRWKICRPQLFFLAGISIMTYKRQKEEEEKAAIAPREVDVYKRTVTMHSCSLL